MPIHNNRSVIPPREKKKVKKDKTPSPPKETPVVLPPVAAPPVIMPKAPKWAPVPHKVAEQQKTVPQKVPAPWQPVQPETAPPAAQPYLPRDFIPK